MKQYATNLACGSYHNSKLVANLLLWITNIYFFLLKKTWVKSNQLTQFYFVILFSMMTIFKILSFFSIFVYEI